MGEAVHRYHQEVLKGVSPSQAKKSTVEPVANQAIADRSNRLAAERARLPKIPVSKLSPAERKAKAEERTAYQQAKRAAKKEAKKNGKKFNKDNWKKEYLAKRGKGKPPAPEAGGKGGNTSTGGRPQDSTGPARPTFKLDGSGVQREVEFGSPKKAPGQ